MVGRQGAYAALRTCTCVHLLTFCLIFPFADRPVILGFVPCNCDAHFEANLDPGLVSGPELFRLLKKLLAGWKPDLDVGKQVSLRHAVNEIVTKGCPCHLTHGKRPKPTNEAAKDHCRVRRTNLTLHLSGVHFVSETHEFCLRSHVPNPPYRIPIIFCCPASMVKEQRLTLRLLKSSQDEYAHNPFSLRYRSLRRRQVPNDWIYPQQPAQATEQALHPPSLVITFEGQHLVLRDCHPLHRVLQIFVRCADPQWIVDESSMAATLSRQNDRSPHTITFSSNARQNVVPSSLIDNSTGRLFLLSVHENWCVSDINPGCLLITCYGAPTCVYHCVRDI